MPNVIVCPACRRRLQLPDQLRAETVLCPACGADFAVDVVEAGDVAVLVAPLPPSEPVAEVVDVIEDEGGAAPASRAPDPRLIIRPPRARGRTIVMVTLASVAALVGLVSFAALSTRRQEAPSVLPPGLEQPWRADPERQQEVRKALAGPIPLVPAALAAELKPLFDHLGARLRAGDSDGVSACFDFERMADEIAAGQGPAHAMVQADRRGLVQGMRAGLAGTLTERNAVMQWDRFEVRHARKLNDNEVVIIARHHAPNGLLLKMRWWVTRRAGEWKVYDMEDLDGAARLTTTVSSLVGMGLGTINRHSRNLQLLKEAMDVLIIRHDPDEAEKKLAPLVGVRLPGDMEALHLLARGMVHLQRGQAAEALVQLDKSRAIRPDMPLLDFLKGTALSRLGKWEEALKYLEAYRDLLGEDAFICQELGEALRNGHRFAEAARAYRKSLDFEPTNADSFRGLLNSLSEVDDKDDLAQRFLKLEHRRENFQTFVEDAEHRDFIEVLEPILVALRKADPQYAPAELYLALVRARAGKSTEATALFRSALGREPDAKARQDYALKFQRGMARAGKYVEAYNVSPDAREAFRALAAEATKSHNTEQLRQLVAVHKKGHPGEPLVALYQAEVYAQDGRYAQADRAFTAALALRPDADTVDLFRSSRVLARYHTGRGLAAYRDIGPRADTFGQLGSLALNNDDLSFVEALLDLHARNEPDSLDLLCFQCRLKACQGKVAEATALLKTALARRLPDAKREEVVSFFLSDLATAGKIVEAYKAAPDAKKAFEILAEQFLEDGDPRDLAKLVAAHRQSHPDDPWLVLYEGEAHLLENAPDKAARALARGLETGPEELRTRVKNRYVDAMALAGKALEALQRVGASKDIFVRLADQLSWNKKGAELEALVQAYRPQQPHAPQVAFYQALAKAFGKRPKEAVPLFLTAWQKQTDENQRHMFQNRFLLALAEVVPAGEAYRLAPQKEAALETLASNLVAQKRGKELAALLDEHARSGMKGRRLDYYRGELLLLRGQADEAAQVLKSCLAQTPATSNWKERNALYRARVKSGKAVLAYRDAGQGTEPFLALASLCQQEKDAKQLQALIDAHRQAMPDDVNLPAWELEARWLKKDYEGTLKLMDEQREDAFAMWRFRYKADDYRVRCLLRLKRTAEAIRAAQALAQQKHGNHLPLVLAHAAAGDVHQAMAAIGKSRSGAWLVVNCYRDPDLGPILRSQAFAAFREKFPQPKEPADKNEPPDDDP